MAPTFFLIILIITVPALSSIFPYYKSCTTQKCLEYVTNCSQSSQCVNQFNKMFEKRIICYNSACMEIGHVGDDCIDSVQCENSECIHGKCTSSKFTQSNKCLSGTISENYPDHSFCEYEQYCRAPYGPCTIGKKISREGEFCNLTLGETCEVLSTCINNICVGAYTVGVGGACDSHAEVGQLPVCKQELHCVNRNSGGTCERREFYGHECSDSTRKFLKCLARANCTYLKYNDDMKIYNIEREFPTPILPTFKSTSCHVKHCAEEASALGCCQCSHDGDVCDAHLTCDSNPAYDPVTCNTCTTIPTGIIAGVFGIVVFIIGGLVLKLQLMKSKSCNKNNNDNIMAINYKQVKHDKVELEQLVEN